MLRGLKTRGNRFCGAYNYAQTVIRAAYLADMTNAEYRRRCRELEEKGRTVVDGWLILKCKDCGLAYPDTEKHRCLKRRIDITCLMQVTRLCPVCGRLFVDKTKLKNKKYCSKACAWQAKCESTKMSKRRLRNGA